MKTQPTILLHNITPSEFKEELIFSQKEVFAEWYSGTIRLPIEKEEYLPYMFALLENGLFLKFKKGILVSSKVVTDKPM